MKRQGLIATQILGILDRNGYFDAYLIPAEC
jgi:hypothetical protein